jgi:hypothetical protein
MDSSIRPEIIYKSVPISFLVWVSLMHQNMGARQEHVWRNKESRANGGRLKPNPLRPVSDDRENSM